MVESRGLSRRLRLSTALSLAKALAEPSPMARLGQAQTGSARPGIRLWAGPGTSLCKIPTMDSGLRLQPFSICILTKGQVYGNSWINSITIYIRIIYSIYTVVDICCKAIFFPLSS